jgi:Spy/CpxP family protein refolding chaperone
MFSPSLSFSKAFVATFLCTAALAVSTFAQAPAGQGNPPGGNPPGQGGRADFRQRMMDRLKESLAASDDEWKAIEPRLTVVMDAQRATSNRGGGFGGPGGGRTRGNRGGGAPDAAAPGAAPAATPAPTDRPPTAVETAAKALQTTLDNKSATPDDIKAKLTALRDAKTQAKATLTKAQDDLRELLTARQEAVLVGFGMLE